MFFQDQHVSIEHSCNVIARALNPVVIAHQVVDIILRQVKSPGFLVVIVSSEA